MADTPDLDLLTRLPFLDLVARLPKSRQLPHLRDEEQRLLVELGRVRQRIDTLTGNEQVAA